MQNKNKFEIKSKAPISYLRVCLVWMKFIEYFLILYSIDQNGKYFSKKTLKIQKNDFSSKRKVEKQVL